MHRVLCPPSGADQRLDQVQVQGRHSVLGLHHRYQAQHPTRLENLRLVNLHLARQGLARLQGRLHLGNPVHQRLDSLHRVHRHSGNHNSQRQHSGNHSSQRLRLGSLLRPCQRLHHSQARNPLHSDQPLRQHRLSGSRRS
jgi:hypothetical protein